MRMPGTSIAEMSGPTRGPRGGNGARLALSEHGDDGPDPSNALRRSRKERHARSDPAVAVDRDPVRHRAGRGQGAPVDRGDPLRRVADRVFRGRGHHGRGPPPLVRLVASSTDERGPREAFVPTPGRGLPLVRDVDLLPLAIDRFEGILGPERSEACRRTMRTMRTMAELLEGRRLWHVGS